MKKRVLSLLLALVLAVSIFAIPVEAASAKQVHTYLMNLAKQGKYDSDAGLWFANLPVGEELSYGVFYLESSGYIELSVYSDNYEVTWRISSNPSPAYNAYVLAYQGNDAKGNFQVQAGYNGSDYSGFKSFEGDSSRKSELLSVVNEWMPLLVEITRIAIHEKGYTLADLGITGYKQCLFIHVPDAGKVTQKPTCSQPGTKTYTCEVCGYKWSEYMSPTNQHVWDAGSVVKQPSCTEDGIRTFTCTVCKTATKNEQIPALGHTWVLDKVLSKPTSPNSHGIARFLCTRCQTTKRGRLCAGEVFTDMPADDNWAHAAIDWAYFGGITSGKTATTFAPKATVTRAEVVSFLYKAMGSPEPAVTENPFTDVAEGKYYYNPVLWAVGAGVTTGATPTSFAPRKNCTRAQIVSFLWNAAGRPEPSLTENPFPDVSENKYYYKAVLWAYENHVTGGVSATAFGPNRVCTRAQTVTFLYKAYALLQTEN